MKTLEQQTVLITGVGGGIGRELARQFVAAGSNVILTTRSASALRQTLVVLGDTGAGGLPKGRIIGTILGDLTTPEGCEHVYQQCMRITPALDILVNNAGMAVVGVISDVPQARWEQVMQVNLLAPMRLTALFLPAMIARRSGHIVNIASVTGFIGFPSLSVYSASKFGLRGFSEALAADVAPFGIDVTVLYPFFVRTGMLEAERFGMGEQPLPDRLLYNPAFVAKKLLQGTRTRQLHVYPGAVPKLLEGLRRFAPGVLTVLMGRLGQRMQRRTRR